MNPLEIWWPLFAGTLRCCARRSIGPGWTIRTVVRTRSGCPYAVLGAPRPGPAGGRPLRSAARGGLPISHAARGGAAPAPGARTQPCCCRRCKWPGFIRAGRARCGLRHPYRCQQVVSDHERRSIGRVPLASADQISYRGTFLVPIAPFLFPTTMGTRGRAMAMGERRRWRLKTGGAGRVAIAEALAESGRGRRRCHPT